MRSPFSKLVLLVLLLSACSPAAPEAAPTHIPTNTPEPSRTPQPTSTRPPTPIILTDPRIAELESLGYTRSDFSFYSIHDNTFHQLTQGNLSYLQYRIEPRTNYVLVFTVLENGQNRVISTVDISTITHRVYDPILSPIQDFGCAPMMGWEDVNQNGRPDIVVGCYWGGGYTGSEIHIFEVDNNLNVTNLTGNLPGMISADWSYQASTQLMVIDPVWEQHDCSIYPHMFVYWMYEWRDGKYVDITPEIDPPSSLHENKAVLTAQFGQPFDGNRHIRRLTELLIMYDKMGQREKGWQEYLSMADLENWPGTDAENAAWLKSDVEHFQKQYELDQPFTPNNYHCSP